MDSTTQYAAGGMVLAVVLGFFLLQQTELMRWLQKKNYQYEVTFALYMLTPTEKFVFNSILFLTLSMLILACTLYLPNHIATMSRRAYYYFAGDAALVDVTRASSIAFDGAASKASEAVCDAASGFYQAAVNTAAVAQEAVQQAVQTMGWGSG